MKAVRRKDHKACLTQMPARDGVRVRSAAAGICSSDLHMIAMDFPLPFTLGHEISGSTDNVTAVAMEPIAASGCCACCLRGECDFCALDSKMVASVRTAAWPRR